MSNKYLDSGKFYSKVQILTAIMSLIRNIVIARVLAVDEFGLAATIGIVISFVEMSTVLAFDKYLLKSRFGINNRVVGVTHSLGIIRGAVVALLLFTIAEPVSLYFRVPDKAWMFELLALSPFIRGFLHQNAVVHQKQGSFYRLSQIELIPQLFTTLTIYPASLYFSDATVALYALLLASVGAVIVSHFLASSPFRLYFKKAILLDVLQYSWPLMVTGALMFIVLQGDKVIIGRYYSLQELALVTVLYSLFLMPVLVFSRIVAGVGIPLVARELNLHSGVASRDFVISIVIIVACLAVAGFNSFGRPVIEFLYGEGYVPEHDMILVVSIIMGLRILRMPVQVFSLAYGDSKNGMYVSVARALALLPSLYLAVNGYDISVILSTGIAGELMGMFIGVLLARSVVPPDWNISMVIFSVIWFCSVSIFSHWVDGSYGIHPVAGFVMQFTLLFIPFFLILKSKFTMEFIQILKRV